MRSQFLLSSLTTILTVGLVSTINSVSVQANDQTMTLTNETIYAQANNQVSFICREGHDKQTNQSQYTTYAWTPEGKRAIIRWVKDWFKSTTWTPKTRCEAVSQRFQEAYNNGSLRYIANGWKNNQPVVCTAREKGGDCVTILMTLRPEDDPISVTRNVVDLLNGRGTGVLRHSADDTKLQQYYEIDFEKFLEVAPIE